MRHDTHFLVPREGGLVSGPALLLYRQMCVVAVCSRSKATSCDRIRASVTEADNRIRR